MENAEYKSIFKSTFLFAFVQVFNIAIKVVYNKIAAILLGPSGIGLIGLFQNTTNVLRTGCGLGIPQSAVRDISEANVIEDKRKMSEMISVTDKIVYITTFIGVIVTVALSPFLSKWTIGNYDYILSYIILSLCVGFSILAEGKLAILKGLRRLKDLAKASMIGSLIGLFVGVPFYYFLGEGGIVPSLVIVGVASYLVTELYLKKVNYERVKMSFDEFKRKVIGMLKMGCALMLVTFVTLVFDLVIASYISYHDGLYEVGLYNAGVTIISSYFGIIVTAMSTDYYPRISAINSDNTALQTELNRQSEVGLILVFPLVVFFIFFSSWFIKFLYDSSFEQSNQYTNYALLGTIMIIVSNSMGMILLAKQATMIFLWSLLCQRLVLIGIYIWLYNIGGLLGLGIAYIITGVIHIGLMSIILWKYYDIKLKGTVWRLLALVLVVAIAMIACRSINTIWLKYFFGLTGTLFALVYTLYYCRKNLDIDIVSTIKHRIQK